MIKHGVIQRCKHCRSSLVCNMLDFEKTELCETENLYCTQCQRWTTPDESVLAGTSVFKIGMNVEVVDDKGQTLRMKVIEEQKFDVSSETVQWKMRVQRDGVNYVALCSRARPVIGQRTLK